MEDDEARADRRNRRKHSCLISRVSSRHAARLDSREESFIYIYIFRWAQEFRVPSLGLVIREKKEKEKKEKEGVKEKGKNYRKNSVPKVVIF